HGRGRTVLIPNAADLGPWQGATDLRRQLGVGSGQRLIGIVGRLTPWKGQRVFLEAAGRLIARDRPGQPDRYHFVVAGDDSVGNVPGYRDELERLAAHDGLPGRVQFLAPPP